ncbi:phage baseplate assembly protein V [Asticcacaulis taihuensis]|uniref:phage baseplate assembly protein V n=1 Tax=Asticcacaulis taihuensis TaxID=260084 RepID=UPI0026EE79D6|nr:phage baseplate assembly protein V [Asticcacaulis taihuensis]
MSKTNDDIGLLIGDIIRKGVIETVDLASGEATVKVGEVISPPLPWCEAAGAISTWCPPSVGEQVIVLCMEADIESGVILRGLRTDTFPVPATGSRAFLKMPDGATFDYDYQGNAFVITLPGSIKLVAPAGLEIEADVKITGDMDLTGDTKLTGKLDLSGKATLGADLDVSGNATLGAGASKFVKLADSTNATTVKAK